MIPDNLWSKEPFDHLPDYMQGIMELGIAPELRSDVKGNRVRCPFCQKETTLTVGKTFSCNGCGYRQGFGFVKPKPKPKEEPPKQVRIRKIICVRCGKEVEAKSACRRYCDECRAIIVAEKRGRTIVEQKQEAPADGIRRCAFCGADITGRHKNSRYCSVRCYDKARWQREKGAGKLCQV